MSATFDNPVMEIVRTFDAPPARVFDAWLEKDQWEAWIGPENCKCDVTLFEPRVGGRYHLLMKLTDGRRIPVVGEFKAIDRPNGFAMTWGSDLAEGATLVTVRLRAVGDKTEMTLRHEGLKTVDDRKGHSMGWNSALNKLARFVKGETP